MSSIQPTTDSWITNIWCRCLSNKLERNRINIPDFIANKNGLFILYLPSNKHVIFIKTNQVFCCYNHWKRNCNIYASVRFSLFGRLFGRQISNIYLIIRFGNWTSTFPVVILFRKSGLAWFETQHKVEYLIQVNDLIHYTIKCPQPTAISAFRTR